jgi:hypothetical protein
MPPHFQPGQAVRFSSRGLRTSTAAGEYRIVTLPPDDGGEPRYCVKSFGVPHERVAQQSELRFPVSEK